MHIDKLAIEELRLLVLLYKTHSLKDSAVRLNVSTPTASRMLAKRFGHDAYACLPTALPPR